MHSICSIPTISIGTLRLTYFCSEIGGVRVARLCIYFYFCLAWCLSLCQSVCFRTCFRPWISPLCSDLAETVEVQPSMPRNHGGQRNRPNAPADNPSEYWRLNMYLPFIDHLIAELNLRLLSAETSILCTESHSYQGTQLNDATGDLIFNTYSDEITLSQCEFRSELSRWKAKWSGPDKVPENIQDTLNMTNKDLYPGIYTILNIFACMPV